MNLKKMSGPATGFVFVMSTALLPASLQAADDQAEKLREAQSTLSEAAKVVQKMKTDPEVLKQLKTAEGLFIIPDYARAAVAVGGYGGEGVLVTRDGEKWSSPVFYNFGGITGGAQVGVEAGQIAMVLTNDKAVDSFMTENNFSLNADAGITLVDFSERAQAAAGKGDVIIWSDTKGAYADLAVGVENISWDKEETKAFYQENVTNPNMITSGKVSSDRKTALTSVLP